MKILFVIYSLKGGGAERVLALIANEFSSKKHKVLIYTYLEGSVYKLNNDIIHKPIFHDSEILTGILGNIKFFTRLKNIIELEKPEIVISFMLGMNKKVIPVTKIVGVPVIVSEHNSYENKTGISSWIERHILYKFADSVVILTKYDYKKFYSKFLNNVTVIPNPLSFTPVNVLGTREKTILAAGNLDRWSHKGLDNLLNIFYHIKKIHPEWKLKIAGEGKNGKLFLLKLVEKLDLQKDVIFLGFCEDISKELKKSSIFVLSSRFEGFPMVLLEAMSQGCTCISFDCISGPREIIENNVDGLLIENQNMKKMKNGILRLIEDKVLCEFLAKNAIQNINRLSISEIGNSWIELINETIKKR